MRVSSLFLAIAGLIVPAASFADTIYYVSTGQSNANTTIDADHTSSWVFSSPSNFDLGGGKFVMKEGSGTSAPSTLSIWLGNIGDTLVASLSLTESAFCAQLAPHCGQYAEVDYFFETPVTLNGGSSYTVALSSSAGTNGSEQYFIKADDTTPLIIADAGGNVLPAEVTPDVPEPSTTGLYLVGLAGIVLYTNRKRLTATR